MAYQASQRVLLAQIEGTPGTPETDITAADFDCMVYEPEFDFAPEFDSGLKVATPDAGKYEDVPGARMAKVTFKVKMTPPSAANTTPKYGKFLRACGLVGAAQSTTGYTFTPLKAGEGVSLTIWIVDITRGGTPTGYIHKFGGCMGTAKLGAAGVGKPVELDFEFTGKYLVSADIANSPLAALVVPTSTDTINPYILTNCAVVAGGVTQKISSFSLDFGNDIQPEINTGDADSTGYDLFSIAERNPQFSYNPLKQAVATYGMEAKTLASTLETYTLTLDKTIDLKITVCNGQIIGAKDAVREGAIAWDTTVKCLRNGTDGSVKASGIVVEAPFEILFGTK